MSSNTSVSLDAHFTTFLSESVSSGRYGSASEVIRAGLRLLEEHDHKLELVRHALTAGENSGSAKEFDFDRFVESKKSQ